MVGWLVGFVVVIVDICCLTFAFLTEKDIFAAVIFHSSIQCSQEEEMCVFGKEEKKGLKVKLQWELGKVEGNKRERKKNRIKGE